MHGLYFFPPGDTDVWRIKNYSCVLFYYPLIVIDEWVGTGKGIGCEPMWRLTGDEKGRNRQGPNPRPESPAPSP
jgi:hypothetical protein